MPDTRLDVGLRPTTLPAPAPTEAPAPTPALPARAPLDAREASRAETATPPPAPAAVPSPPAEEPGVDLRKLGKYKRVDGPTFVNGPAPADVKQGRIGDCWFLASLAAVAQRDPEVLERCVAQNPDGTFVVTFHAAVGDPANPWEVVSIGVRPTFPGGNSATVADPSPNGKKELWVAVLEKAYAQFMGGTYELLDGGQPAWALDLLTRSSSSFHSVSETEDLDALYAKLRAAIDADHPMVVATPDRAVFGSPLVRRHAYAVLDAYEKKGKHYVKLYNPHGYEQTIRLDAFRKAVSGITIGGN